MTIKKGLHHFFKLDLNMKTLSVTLNSAIFAKELHHILTALIPFKLLWTEPMHRSFTAVRIWLPSPCWHEVTSYANWFTLVMSLVYVKLVPSVAACHIYLIACRGFLTSPYFLKTTCSAFSIFVQIRITNFTLTKIQEKLNDKRIKKEELYKISPIFN